MKVFSHIFFVFVSAVLFIATSALCDDGYDTIDISALEQAVHSDSIPNFLGLNTHFDYSSYKLSPTFFDDVLKPAILELGVRHLHDSTGEIGHTTESFTGKLKTLSDSGVDFILTINPKLWQADHGTNAYPSPLMQKLRTLQQGGVINRINFSGPINILAYQLGPNEYDHHAPQSDWNGMTWSQAADFYWGTSWKNELLNYNQAAYFGIKSDPVTSLVENVIAVPLVHVDEYARTPGMDVLEPLGNYADKGNAHVYCHHLGPYECLSRNFSAWENFYSGKPMWISEFGFSNANHVSGMTESKASKLFLRNVFEFANRGVEMAYYYSLLDEIPAGGTDLSNLYGIMRSDGSKKPIFYTYKNLLSILSDRGSSFSPGTFQYNVSGSNSNLHKRLLQKRTGEFYIAIWNELISSTETDQFQNITLTFETPMDISIFDPRVSGQPVQFYSNKRAIAVSVPDSVLLVAVKPYIPPTFTPTITSTPIFTPTQTDTPIPTPTITPLFPQMPTAIPSPTTTQTELRRNSCSLKVTLLSKCKKKGKEHQCAARSNLNSLTSPLTFTLEKYTRNNRGFSSWKNSGKRYPAKRGLNNHTLKTTSGLGDYRLRASLCVSGVFRLK